MFNDRAIQIRLFNFYPNKNTYLFWFSERIFRSSRSEVFLRRSCCKATLLKSRCGMGVLLKICCIFSEHLFLRTPLDSCFWVFHEINCFEIQMIKVFNQVFLLLNVPFAKLNDPWNAFFLKLSAWCIIDWVLTGTQVLSHKLCFRVFLKSMFKLILASWTLS